MAGAEGQVIGIHNIEAWKEHFAKGVESKKLVVVDFTASWCGPCRMIAPIFVELAKKLTDVTFLKVDVDEVPPVAQEFEVEAMPTFIFLKEGKVVEKMVGAKKDDLIKLVERHSALTGPSAPGSASA